MAVLQNPRNLVLTCGENIFSRNATTLPPSLVRARAHTHGSVIKPNHLLDWGCHFHTIWGAIGREILVKTADAGLRVRQEARKAWARRDCMAGGVGLVCVGWWERQYGGLLGGWAWETGCLGSVPSPLDLTRISPWATCLAHWLLCVMGMRTCWLRTGPGTVVKVSILLTPMTLTWSCAFGTAVVTSQLSTTFS